MRSRLILVTVAAATGALLLLPAPAAFAKDNFECNGSFTGVSLNGGVVVKNGDTCTLTDATVNGGLDVQPGARISVTDSTINGGWVFDDGFETTYQCGDTVNGGLLVENIADGLAFSFGEANASCDGGRINGGAQIINNTNAGALEIDATRIDGGVADTNNNTGAFLNEIEGDTVKGQGNCTNDTPAVVNDGDGGPSTFTGPNDGCPTS